MVSTGLHCSAEIQTGGLLCFYQTVSGYPVSSGLSNPTLTHLVVLSVFTAFQRLVFISGQFIYYLASTFKPNGSSSSTDYNQEKRNYKVLKSESDFVEAFISSPKRFIFPSTRHLFVSSDSK